MAEFPTFKGSWPWPWIGSYCIPSCITRRPLPTSQISLILKNPFVDGRSTDIWDPLYLLGRHGGVDLKMSYITLSGSGQISHLISGKIQLRSDSKNGIWYILRTETRRWTSTSNRRHGCVCHIDSLLFHRDCSNHAWGIMVTKFVRIKGRTNECIDRQPGDNASTHTVGEDVNSHSVLNLGCRVDVSSFQNSILFPITLKKINTGGIQKK